jgi:CHAT domain-containing protein/tetratricopeptide (TPR) repeat protein
MKSIIKSAGILFGLALFGGTGTVRPVAVASVRQHPATLIPGVSTTGKLNGVPINYSLELKFDDYFSISVPKTGTDIEVRVLRPDGRMVRSVSCSHVGPVQLSELALMPGRYTVQLNSCEEPGIELSYELVLSPPRVATRADRLRVAAERLSAEAQLLVAEYRAESSRAAIRKYEDVLDRWKAIGDRTEIVRTLISIAEIYLDLGDSKLAANYAEMAWTATTGGQEPKMEAEALVTLGTVLLREGNTARSMESAYKALDISHSILNRSEEAEALWLLGLAHRETAEYDNAVDAFEKARAIWQGLANRDGLGRVYHVLAAIDAVMSRPDSALENGRRALSIFKSLNDRQWQARVLILLGNLQTRVSRKQDALNLYEEAEQLLRDSGDLYWQAALLSGIARTYLDLGDRENALRFFSQALDKHKSLGNRASVAYMQRAIGNCYFASGDAQNALLYLNQALNTFRQLSNKRMEAWLLADIAIVYEAMGEAASARDYLNQVLQLSRSIADRPLEASALIGLGHIHERAGEFPPALEYHEQALRLSEAAEDRLGRVTALYRIGECLREMGKLDEARARVETALEEVEKLRASVANTDLRTSYFASVRRQYELLIDVLMRLHREKESASWDVRAFEASERSRARALLDSIGETQISISEGVDPKQLARQVSLRASLDAKAERYTQLRGSDPTSKAVQELGNELRALTAEYDELQGQIRVRSPHYAALVQPEPSKLVQIQNDLLDAQSLLLEYSVGDENSYLWAVTRESFASFILPKHSEIENKVRRIRELMMARVSLPGEKPADFHARLTAAEVEYPQAAAELSRILLGPVADRLGTRRVVIVAEGVLQYLPFGALPTPQSLQSSSFTPLIVEHDIVNLPSASTLAVIRREAPLRGIPDKTIAVFADPVFQATDSRVRRLSSTQSAPARVASRTAPAASVAQVLRGSDALGMKFELPRLPSTRQEAEAILAMVPEDRRMAALGFSATKAAAMNPELKRYRIVHFATHTILNDDHPDLSSLVLSLVDEKGNPQSGFLRLRDMYNLQLAAELVVLSACDTGLGKEVKGEGLMSMVRGFMYSGTPRVLASLWKVDDEATAELMKEFYKHLLQEGMTPATALRQAQITQMQKKSRQSPYYWAGFQLQGEWN